MPRENVSAFNFTSGEVSPYIAGRVDTKIYANGVRTCENFIVRPQGGVSRRNGSRMVEASWDHDHTSLLVPFTFSDVQAYVLQFGNGFIHFFKNGEPLLETTTTEVENFGLSANGGLYQVTATAVNDLPGWGKLSAFYAIADNGTATVSAGASSRVRITFSVPHTLRTGVTVFVHETAATNGINLLSFTINRISAYAIDLVGSTFVTAVGVTGVAVFSHGLLAGDRFYISGAPLYTTLTEQYHIVKAVISHLAWTIANVDYFNFGAVTGEEAWTIPIEVIHPYTSSELEELRFAQSADVLYIMHPDHPVMKLTRLDNDGDRGDWLLSEVVFTDGPYLPLNDNAPNVDMVTPANGSRFSDVYLELTGYTHTAKATITLAAKTVTLSNDGGNYLVTSVAHGFTAGQNVLIAGTGTTADGVRVVTAAITADTFHIALAFGSVGVAGTAQLIFVDATDDDGAHYLEYRDGDQWRLAKVQSGGIATGTRTMATVDIIDNVLLYLDEATRFKNTPKQGSAPSGSNANSAWTPVYGHLRNGGLGIVRYQKLDPNNQVIDTTVTGTGSGVLNSNFANTFGVSDVGKFVRYVNKSGDALWALITKVGLTGATVNHAAAVTMVNSNSIGNFVITNEARSATVKAYRAGAAHALFVSSDVGRHIRMSWGGRWAWGKIATYVGTNEVTVTFYVDLPRDPHDASNLAGALNGTMDAGLSSGRTYSWRLGAWSVATGYPSTACFHEQRLLFARTDTQPATFWGSITGDFENMSPTELDGTVLDDSGIDFTLASGKVNAIKWMESGTTLVVGTNGGEWVVGATSVTQEAITPTNISVHQQSRNGSSRVAQPMRIGSSIVFVDRSESNVMEVTYLFLEDRLEDKDLTIASEHIIRQGGTVVQTAFQQNPHCIGWFLLSDGTLSAVTYNDDQEIIAWHRHELAGTGAFIESICCVPNEDGTADDLYLFVKRTINGSTKRYIEMMEPEFYSSESNESSVSIASTASNGTPNRIRVATSSAHGYVSGAIITISGATWAGAASTNGTWTIIVIDSTHFDLIGSTWVATVTGTAILSSESKFGMQFVDCSRTIEGFAGTVVTGLEYLTGETIAVLGNGVLKTITTDYTFSAGVLTLVQAYDEVVVGLPYTSTLKSLPIEGGSSFGVSVGMKKQIKEMKARIADSFGLNAGYSASALVSYDYTTRNDSETTLPFFSGTVPIVPKHPNREDNPWLITYALPYPLNILCVVSVIETTQ